MRSAVIYLIGYPGVGKLTVAKQLAALIDARLMDNHLVNNVIFSLIDTYGSTPIPEAVWDEVKRVRDAAFRVIANHTDPARSFILTNVLLNEPSDRMLFAQVERLANDRRSVFVPVVLHCDPDENMKRLVQPDRKVALKETDVVTARRRRISQPLLPFESPYRLVLDITRLAPLEAAQQIAAHVRSLMP